LWLLRENRSFFEMLPLTSFLRVVRCLVPAGLGTAGLTAASQIHAHEAGSRDRPAMWSAWSDQPWLWLFLVVAGALYLAGTLRLWQRASPGAGIRKWQAAAFVAGWLALCASIVSPLDALGSQLFWMHMLQHETMMLIAAPLLVLSRPLAPMTWSLPQGWRTAVANGARALGFKWSLRTLTRPLAAWSIHALVLWGWHAPAPFEAALKTQWVHDLQHLSFFISALLFWWALFPGAARRNEPGVGILYIFTTAAHTAALGALLTFSRRLFYPTYEATAPAWGMSALQDQQLGGLIMWIPGGVVYLAAGLALFAAWLSAAQRPTRPGISSGM
jgi:putative membrane protein